MNKYIISCMILQITTNKQLFKKNNLKFTKKIKKTNKFIFFKYKKHYKNNKFLVVQKNNYFLKNLFFLNKLPNTINKHDILLSNNWIFFLYFKYLNFYYTKFFINWNFININDIVNFEAFCKTYKFICKRKIVSWLFPSKHTFYDSLLQLSQFKDTELIIFQLEKYLTKLHLKKHRRGFYLIRAFFLLWFKIFSVYFNIKGFSLFFKGKLGKKGSVKKKKFFVKYGAVSHTNKNLRVNYRTYIISTLTGVVGCGINIYF